MKYDKLVAEIVSNTVEEMTVEPWKDVPEFANAAHNVLWNGDVVLNLFNVCGLVLVDADWYWEVGHGNTKVIAIVAGIMRDLHILPVIVECGDFSLWVDFGEWEMTPALLYERINTRSRDLVTLDEYLVNLLAN